MSASRRVGLGLAVGAGVSALAAGISWAAVHFTSPAVRLWRPGVGAVVRRHGLASRKFGTGDPVIVLLSGLAASERFWGAAFNRLAHRATVLAIDPRGFGSSASAHDDRDPADPRTHTAMLSEVLAERGFDGRPIVIIGHSLGASLALRWAATTSAVRAVVCLGAPLYRDDDEVSAQMRHLGWFESLLARGPFAERVCHWMCAHRTAAGRLAVALRPGTPTPIARDGVRHTWPGYIGAFTALIAHPGWEQALADLAAREIPVLLVEGASDRVPVPGRAAELAAKYETVRALTVDGGHDLPLSNPDACVALIEAVADGVRVNGE